MADAEIAFQFVMKNEDPTLEGKIVPEPHGAKARFGINSIAHPEAITDGFYEMNVTDAFNYARNTFTKTYWTPIYGDEIKDQTIANKWVDLVYNIYTVNGIKVMQRALNSQYATMILMVDGVVGPKTLEAVNEVDPTQLLHAFQLYATEYYHDVVRAEPELETYLTGWLKRLDA